MRLCFLGDRVRNQIGRKLAQRVQYRFAFKETKMKMRIRSVNAYETHCSQLLSASNMLASRHKYFPEMYVERVDRARVLDAYMNSARPYASAWQTPSMARHEIDEVFAIQFYARELDRSIRDGANGLAYCGWHVDAMMDSMSVIAGIAQ